VVRNRFGFFGQLTPYKGVDVLLEAMRIIERESRLGDDTLRSARAWIHGSNLDLQPGEFQNKFHELSSEASNVTVVGRYDHASIPQLMANIDWVVVPSIWWENSPLVIQEAFHHLRPVICSDIGGMAEKVQDGVNGLHFQAGKPESLADAIRHATATEGLWERLREGIPEVYPMNRHVSVLGDVYRTLVEERTNGGRRRAR
jgi:glycosyltransferase involved in cell wall biosynthesis